MGGPDAIKDLRSELAAVRRELDGCFRLLAALVHGLTDSRATVTRAALMGDYRLTRLADPEHGHVTLVATEVGERPPLARHRCGSCGSTGIVVESTAGSPWRVSCSNGHVWVLDRAQDARLEFPEVDGGH